MEIRRIALRLCVALMSVILFFVTLDYVYQTGFDRGVAMRDLHYEYAIREIERLGFCNWLKGAR